MASEIDLEEWMEWLHGPLGEALRASGVIMERRLKETGLTWFDLDDHQVADLFLAAFREAAPAAYPHRDPAELERALDQLAATIQMGMAATADGSDTIN
ncbi:hypothetical protein [Brevundimonas naejangsanensis]|uniref:hypothetical protein n=1 Tax=Brevundimonas naejangsanensis TaxID=588932 RepID=UPI00106CB444|nr:hypothetical protein [Brevundimonas naejangsanensis]QBQ49105.1 hypothetical protein E3U41_10665 [Brevundimonas naejangsanensis]